MSATQTAGGALLAPEGATLVEGSDGLLLELDGKIFPNYDATITHFEEGEVVSGTVVRIDKDEVLLDIGWKSEGVIPSHELSIRRSVDPSDEVSLGEAVDALVLTKEDAEGRLILSKKRARFEKAWRKIEAAAESGEPVEGTVIEVVKGGLILDLGVRGFLPASLVDIRRVHNLEEFTGGTLECKVIELNRSRNNVVLSRRAVLEDERKEVREQILTRLQPGQIVEGKVSNIVDFGAFVDLEGIDGLIHISEISWSHVNHPSEVLKIGETVKVKVLDIDRDRQRISLGLKQTQEDPWQTVLNSYGPGSSLSGKVTKVVAFGAFVEIVPGVEGLVHISELAEHHVETPGEVVQPDEEVRVKILEIDEERRRISLSIKRVGEGGLPLRDAFQAAASQAAGDEPAASTELGLSEEVFAETPPAKPAGLEITDEDLAAAHAAVEAEAAEAADSPEAEAPEAEAPEAEAAAEAPADEAATDAPETEAPEAEAAPSRPPTRPQRRLRPKNPTAIPRPKTPDPVPGPSLIGLTGGIAAGKSEALRILAELGAETVSTDGLVHELLGTEAVRDRLVGRWGEEVAPAGEVDRAVVAAIVFERPDELAWLESVLHPLVGERVHDWAEQLPAGTSVAVVEVPLLFEGSMAARFDATIAVIADDEDRSRRAAARGTGELEARSGRQLTQEEKAARATHVIVNNGTMADLERELTRLYPELAGAG